MKLGVALLVALLVAPAALGGCKKADEPAPARDVPTMPAAEAKRGQDACRIYVEQVCACADKAPALKDACALARALPDALDVSLSVATNPESTRRDVVQANDSARKIVKECIEATAKLAGQGCA